MKGIVMKSFDHPFLESPNYVQIQRKQPTNNKSPSIFPSSPMHIHKMQRTINITSPLLKFSNTRKLIKAQLKGLIKVNSCIKEHVHQLDQIIVKLAVRNIRLRKLPTL